MGFGPAMKRPLTEEFKIYPARENVGGILRC